MPIRKKKDNLDLYQIKNFKKKNDCKKVLKKCEQGLFILTKQPSRWHTYLLRLLWKASNGVINTGK